MSDADRQKWDAIYSQPVQADAKANAWLRQHMDVLQPARALDVATGRGRNALYLAKHGYVVDAVDISPVAIEQLQHSAHAAQLQVHAWVQDLMAHPKIETEPGYQLIVMLRFVAPAVLAQLPGMLSPGGYLLVEQHMQWPEPVSGPNSQRFRVAPGELAEAPADCQIVQHSEGLVTHADGSQEALARLLVQKL